MAQFHICGIHQDNVPASGLHNCRQRDFGFEVWALNLGQAGSDMQGFRVLGGQC